MISPTMYLLCTAPPKWPWIQRGGLLVGSRAICGMKHGETYELSAMLKTRSVDTAPHRFSTSLAGSEALGVGLSAPIEETSARLNERFNETPRHSKPTSPFIGLLSAIVSGKGGGSCRGGEIHAEPTGRHMIASNAKILEFVVKMVRFAKASASSAVCNDPANGLLLARIPERRKLKMVWRLSGVMGLGSNLVAMAQHTLPDVRAASC